MKVVHLGGSPLGDSVYEALEEQGDDVRSATTLDELQPLLEEPVDWIVSAGFRHIVPEGWLARASDACNVHTSYLPWGRGMHPNVWMIAEGEPAGVTIHRMVPRLDAGPIFAQREVPTSFSDLACDLYDRLQDAAVALFRQTWPAIRGGGITPTPQVGDGSHHFHSEMLRLGEIDLDEPISWRNALNTLRALTYPPYRNVVVAVEGRRYHVEVRVEDVTDEASP